MQATIGFYLSGVIAVAIIFIGGRFLVAPSTAAAAYGVPAGAEPHSRAYLSAKGIRDIASGLFIAILIAHGSAHALGWFMLAATLIPVVDAVIVLQQGGSRAVAFGVHGGTAVVMLIISGLLIVGWSNSSIAALIAGFSCGATTRPTGVSLPPMREICHAWSRVFAISSFETLVLTRIGDLQGSWPPLAASVGDGFWEGAMWKLRIATVVVAVGMTTLAWGASNNTTDQWMKCYDLGWSRGVHLELGEMPGWIDECLAGNIPFDVDQPKTHRLLRSRIRHS
jgi:hypothetical protein